MARMTYIYVTPFFPTPTSWRGAVGYDFVKALSETGRYDVRVFTEGHCEPYEIGGVTVHPFPAKRLPSNIFPMLFNRHNERNFIKALDEDGVRPDNVAVVHANTANYAPYALALKNLNPNVLTLLQHHDLQSYGLNLGILRHCWFYNMIQFPVLRNIHEAIDCHVFISEACRRSFLAAPDSRWTEYNDYRRQMRGLPYRPARIGKSLILHNGVDLNLFSPVMRGAHGGEFTIGTVANFVGLKDYTCTIAALSMIKDKIGDWKWRVVGSGPEGLALRKSMLKAGILGNVEFLPEVRHEQLPDFYRSLSLFVMPSYFEGFGCVFTEAYACGVPFVTCTGQGIEDLMDEASRRAWLMKPHDSGRLAEIILRHYQQRTKMQLCGKISTQDIVAEFLTQIDAFRR